MLTVAPDKPTISLELENSIGRDSVENYQQEPGNTIVIDEGVPVVTLVCTVNGGKPIIYNRVRKYIMFFTVVDENGIIAFN